MNFNAIGNREFKGMPSIAIPILLLAISKFLTWIAFPNASLHPDSPSYSTGEKWSFDLVSFLGNSGRPWPVTFFYALFPNDSVRILAQLTVSALVWCYLIFVIKHIEVTSKAKFLIAILLSIVGSSPVVTQWDTTILATSLMLSTSVLIVSLLIRMLFTNVFRGGHFFALLFLIVFLYMQKSSNAPITAVLLIFVILSNREILRKRFRLIVPIVLCCVITWGTIVGLNINNSWEKSYSGATLLWQLGSQSPASTNFKEYLERQADVPSCIYSDAPFKDLNVSIARISESCPNSIEYLNEGIQSDFLNFIFTSPKSVIKLISIGVGASFTNTSSHYGRSVSLFPSAATSFISGDVAPDLRFSTAKSQEEAYAELKSGEPQWLHLPILGILLLALLLLFLSQSFSSKERFGSFVLILANLMQMTVNYVLLPSEWVRQGAPFAFALLIISIIVVTHGLKNIYNPEGLEASR
jgi:hypothetical protein